MNDFGKKIRLHRKLKSLTLKDLAAKTGLSISFLSEVERSICQPSIASLRKIAQALGISLLELSENGDQGSPDNSVDGFARPLVKERGSYITDAKVVRSGRRKRISFPGMKGYFELLTPDMNRLLEVLSFKVEPGYESGQELFQDPPGEKFMLILEGTFEFHVGDDVFVLNAMDSLSYPADAPIFYRTVGEKTVNGILVITPPGF